MENAAEALKMAAAVLIFVLALSISINAFGEARIASRTILDYKDREYDYTYVDDNRDANGNVVTQRIVSLESIVPTTPVEVYSIDLQNEILGNDTQKEQFIMAILYGNRGFENQSDFETINNRFVKNLGIYLNSQGIYDKINNIKLKESIGVYYQEETPTINDDGSFETPAENADVPNANKTLKRVITYSRAE